MLRKLLLPADFALTVELGVAQAQIVVKVAPPRPRSEQRSARPVRIMLDKRIHRWDARLTPGSRADGSPAASHARWIAPRWSNGVTAGYC